MIGRYNGSIDDVYPFCNKDKKDISHLLTNRLFRRDIWEKIPLNCRTPIYTDMKFIDWLKNIWTNRYVHSDTYLAASF